MRVVTVTVDCGVVMVVINSDGVVVDGGSNGRRVFLSF